MHVCVYVFACVCVFVSVRVYMHACMCAWMFTCVHAYVCMCMHLWVVCVCVWMHGWVRVNTWVGACECVFVWKCVYVCLAVQCSSVCMQVCVNACICASLCVWMVSLGMHWTGAYNPIWRFFNSVRNNILNLCLKCMTSIHAFVKSTCSASTETPKTLNGSCAMATAIMPAYIFTVCPLEIA